MVTSSTCMLTIVTSDRERPRLLWKLTSWKSRAGMACSRSWRGSWATQTSLNEWSPKDTYWSRAQEVCSRSWREIVRIPDWSDEECNLVTGSRCWITIVTEDREHPRMHTKNEYLISRAGGACSRSWHGSWVAQRWHDLTYLARDALDPDRDAFVPAVIVHITIMMMDRDKSF